MSGNGCREEVLAAAKAMRASGQAEFGPDEMIQYLHQRGTKYSDSTIRTHVVSRMCANAPDNHPVTYPDLERIDRGIYRLKLVPTPLERKGEAIPRKQEVMPAIDDLKAARVEFRRREPRDLFYRVATELLRLASENKTSLTTTEALAVLLQTWNMAFFRFRPFTEATFKDIDDVLRSNSDAITTFRSRSIRTLLEEDRDSVVALFQDFERSLGPVGAAKSLHLLSPRFFPLWDRAIVKAYGLALRESGKNGPAYVTFMELTKRQCDKLAEAVGEDVLKALDEFNYCHYTKGWMPVPTTASSP